jgi:hypothetical protein
LRNERPPSHLSATGAGLAVHPVADLGLFVEPRVETELTRRKPKLPVEARRLVLRVAESPLGKGKRFALLQTVAFIEDDHEPDDLGDYDMTILHDYLLCYATLRPHQAKKVVNVVENLLYLIVNSFTIIHLFVTKVKYFSS